MKLEWFIRCCTCFLSDSLRYFFLLSEAFIKGAYYICFMPVVLPGIVLPGIVFPGIVLPGICIVGIPAACKSNLR